MKKNEGDTAEMQTQTSRGLQEVYVDTGGAGPQSPASREPENRLDDEELSSEESDDDDLVLEGEVVRDPDVSSSSDDEDDNDDDDEKPLANNSAASAKRSSPPTSSKPKKKKKKRKQKDREENDEMLQVDFCFCDMAEKYYHGLKSLLDNSSTVYQKHASQIADLMIDNVSVGTVVSTEDANDDEADVFGFASVLNVAWYQESPAIEFLKKTCVDKCPTQYRSKLAALFSASDKTAGKQGPAANAVGLLLHGRMINLPMQVTLVLFEQLVQDIDWAVENAEGGEEERRSLDFGTFVRLAPCQSVKNAGNGGNGNNGNLYFRYFEDELFAKRSDLHYTIDAPKSYSKEEKQLLQVMVLTKAGFQAAMKDFSDLVGN